MSRVVPQNNRKEDTGFRDLRKGIEVSKLNCITDEPSGISAALTLLWHLNVMCSFDHTYEPY